MAPAPPPREPTTGAPRSGTPATSSSAGAVPLATPRSHPGHVCDVMQKGVCSDASIPAGDTAVPVRARADAAVRVPRCRTESPAGSPPAARGGRSASPGQSPCSQQASRTPGDAGGRAGSPPALAPPAPPALPRGPLRRLLSSAPSGDPSVRGPCDEAVTSRAAELGMGLPAALPASGFGPRVRPCSSAGTQGVLSWVAAPFSEPRLPPPDG